jgi:hypothetical protein
MNTIPLAVFGTLVSGIVAWIAWQQMEIARTKLQHDLYDRCFMIYDRARVLISEIELHGDVSHDAVRVYATGIAHAVFLLDDGLCGYLNEIQDRAFKLPGLLARENRMPDGDERIGKASDEAEWLGKQLPTLVEKFKPYLQLPGRQRTSRHWRPQC